MATTVNPGIAAASEAAATRPAYQAFRILHLGFTAAPLLAGLDKFTQLIPGYFDVALRDFGLMLGALALGRLAVEFDRG